MRVGLTVCACVPASVLRGVRARSRLARRGCAGASRALAPPHQATEVLLQTKRHDAVILIVAHTHNLPYSFIALNRSS